MAREQVKSELYALLRQEGLQSALKAQVRSKLLTKLKGPPQEKGEDLTGRVIASLVMEYLKKTGKEFTISVFLAETGSAASLSPSELTQLLSISAPPGSDSLLTYIVTEFQRLSTRPNFHESAAQTEDYKAIGHLEDRLHSVEMQYLSKMKSLPAAETLEEKMMQYQRECEARLRLEKEHEIARIREVEVQAVRLEESSKYRQMLIQAREDLDVQWQTRMEQIKEREREGGDRLRLREQDLETQLYLHRQQVLRDMELLRSKEQDLKRQAQVEAQAAKLEKDTWETRRLEAENKTKEIEKVKLALEHKAEMDFEQFKREYETRHVQDKHKLMDELSEVERMKRKLKDEQDRVSSFTQEFLRVKQDLSEARESIADLKSSKERQALDLRSAQDQLRQLSETGRRDLDILSLREQEIATLKSELGLYREMVEESKTATRALDERNKEVVARMGDEVQRLRNTQGGREMDSRVSSLIGTDMALRWKQLERDEEDLKRRAMDWIKPVYKRAKDPFTDLFAPKRESSPSAFVPQATALPPASPRVFRPPPATANIREPVRTEEQGRTETPGGEERKRQYGEPQIAVIPEYKSTPVEISNLPVEIPNVRAEIQPGRTQEGPSEEPDLAEYALRQQRRRQQFDFLGDESEESRSSMYSDRFE